nr:helix-turn-helix domain-containing protein [Micromonospora sp. DSM 115978]
MAAGLFTSDGRPLGSLLLHTDTEAHPTDAALRLIGILTPAIADALDPLRSLAHLAGIVRDAQAGVVLTVDQRPLPLPGLPGHRLLGAGSALLTVAARQLADGANHDSYLCPTSSDPADEDLLRVTVLAAVDPMAYPAAVITLSPPGERHGLDRYELSILGLLAEDQSNRRIAAIMRRSPAGIAEHLAIIMAKLGAQTRAIATLRAFRLGLYIPPELFTAGH